MPEAQRPRGRAVWDEVGKEIYLHYSPVNDFDLSPKGIRKLLHSCKLASNPVKCRLAKGHPAYKE